MPPSTPPAPLTPHQTDPYPLVPLIAAVLVHTAPVPTALVRILPPMLQLRQVPRITSLQPGTDGYIPTPLPCPALQLAAPHQGVAGQAGEGAGPAGGVTGTIYMAMREGGRLTRT